MKKFTDKLTIILVILLSTYILTVTFPQPLFKYHIEYKNFKVYSNQKLDNNIYNILDNVNNKLKISKIYTDKIHYRLFICNNYTKYTYFANINHNSLGITLPLIGHIFIPNTDIKNNLTISNINSKRSLDSIIAHEATHKLLENKYGFIKSRFMTTWKEEGYCDYIAHTSTFNIQEGIKIFKNNQDNNSNEYKYFIYRLRMTYLLNVKKENLDNILNTKYDLNILDNEIKDNLDKINLINN